MERSLLILCAFASLVALACGGGGDAGPSLENKLTESKEAAAKGVYRVTYEGAFQELNSTTTVVNRPPDRRVDIKYDSGDTEAVVLFQGELFECHNRQCNTVSEDNQSVLDRLSFIDSTIAFSEDINLEESTDDIKVNPVVGSTIAGLEAECLEAVRSDVVLKLCFAADSGVLLLLDVENSMQDLRMTIEAISVDLDVQIEDVSPPDI